MATSQIGPLSPDIANKPLEFDPTAELAARINRARAPTGNPSLIEVSRPFLGHASPRILVFGTVASIATRLCVGPLSLWDAVVVLALVAWHPFQEWLIHVHVLHAKPIFLFGKTLDLPLANQHRRHHADPWDVDNLFITPATLLFSVLAHVALVAWWMPPELFLTAMSVAFALGLGYEWTHYLTHTAYRPKSSKFRKVWQYHRLHHFKNERYWMGVSMHLGDWVLKTMPDPKQVETSATARTLSRM